MMTSRRLSRRALVGGALGLAGMVALTGSPHGGAIQPETDLLVPSGHPTVSLARLPRFDAVSDAGTETAWLSTLMYDSPLSIGVDGQLRGGVAVGWSNPADALLIELAIRRDALFADGVLVTAADVAMSIERAWRGLAGAVESWRWERIERVEAVGNERVRIHLREPDVTMLWSLASEHVPIVPTGWIERGWDSATGQIPPGSGPFHLAEVASDELTLVRHPGYWQVGRPRLEGLTIRGASDTVLRTTEFVTSGVDVLIDVPLLDVPLLRVDPGVTLAGRPGDRLCLLSVNMARPGLRERELRQVISNGIDRPALAKAATSSEATPTALLFHEGHWAASDHDPERVSPDEIQAVLTERGFFGGLSLRLVTTEADASLANACVLLQDQLAYAGIALTLDLLDDAELARTLDQGDWDLHAMYSSPWRDPHELLRPLLHSDGPLNHGGYVSARMDSLIDWAATLPVEPQRAEHYRLAQDIELTDVPIIPLFIPNYYDAMTRSLRNYEVYPPVSARGFRQVWMDPPADDSTP
jgi:peptide/nickel transport system substrate-binding protein